MRFLDVLAGLDIVLQSGSNPDVNLVTADSRETRPGALFVAVPGFASDGHRFIDQALYGGASALLLQSGRIPGGESPAGAPRACRRHPLGPRRRRG